VVKRYEAGGTSFHLDVPQLDVRRGAKIALVGESGSGKSTLLELLAMILRPTGCGVFTFSPAPQRESHDSHDIAAVWQSVDMDRLSDLRSRHIGYVLQAGGLLPYLSVRDNINLSRRLLEGPGEDVAEHWAAKLNIAAQLGKKPAALSVGQQQRVAIARALAHEPTVLIADEPTAAVDPMNAGRIMDLMVGLVDDLGVTLIVASHAHELMRRAGLDLIEHRIVASDAESMRVTVDSANE